MDKEKLKKLRRSDFFKAVFLIIFVFVTGWVIFGFTRVYGSAMKPAVCDGDILMYYRLHTEYKAGDMVVYRQTDFCILEELRQCRKKLCRSQMKVNW